MSVFSYNVSNFSRVKNILSDKKAMLLEDKSLLRKKLPEEMLLKQTRSMNLPVLYLQTNQQVKRPND